MSVLDKRAKQLYEESQEAGHVAIRVDDTPWDEIEEEERVIFRLIATLILVATDEDDGDYEPEAGEGEGGMVS